MRISETLSFNIPDDDFNVDRLERYLAKEMERFRKQVFGKGIAADRGQGVG